MSRSVIKPGRQILLIRHGRTAANDAHVYCGSTDLPLSEAGRRELEALRQTYAAGTVFVNSRFITSGMRRTDETLRILFGPVPFETAVGLREMDFGIFEMHGYEELKDDPAYQSWISGDNEANVTPGGESGKQMQRRVKDAFRYCLGFDDRDLVIVTHGGVVAAIMADLFPEEGKNRYEWQPAPGHGYLITGDRYRGQ